MCKRSNGCIKVDLNFNLSPKFVLKKTVLVQFLTKQFSPKFNFESESFMSTIFLRWINGSDLRTDFQRKLST